jgi:GTPase Era involved in 16S rRNA processing
MDNLQQKTVATLREMAQGLRRVSLPGELAAEVEKLAAHAEGDQPCVVAVVGRVKAGKSTFINALLGEDLARTGTTETTATINYFRYGTPHSGLTVRCHWRDGHASDESPAFLDSLQGNDIETLRRADGIAYLEYFLPNDYLKQITLVDTPGTGAVVEEHQNRTAEFMNLNGQLRERHHQETQHLESNADAIIYLIGHVTKATDEAFLKEFAEVTGGKSQALNAVGVISKIDLHPGILERRQEFSSRIAKELENSLNTVIPVSAELRRTLTRLLEDERMGITRLSDKLRRIPPLMLNDMLDSEEFFLGDFFDDCPLTKSERRELLGQMKWAVFTTIARAVAQANQQQRFIVEQLHEVAGFDPLKKALDLHFFQRSHILRCYRAVNDARKVLLRIKYHHLPESLKLSHQDETRLERFLTFIRRSKGDAAVGREIEVYLREHLNGAGRVQVLEDMWTESDEKLSDLFHELEAHNADFEALQKLDEYPHLFSPAQLSELRPLLSSKGMAVENRLPKHQLNVEYVRERQLIWRGLMNEAPRGSVYRAVAECAITRYGLILEELSNR